MAVLRYLVFMAVGVVVASVLFLVLSLLVDANFDAGVGFVERWIERITCNQYELSGTVRDTRGRPVAFAVVEAAYLDERLTTRTTSDGRFTLAAGEAICDRRPPRTVDLIVVADDFRPRRSSIPFDESRIEVTLEPRDFAP